MKVQSIILALAATVAAVPAVAAGAPASAIRVDYRDLDLTTRAGQETLDRRLERAARSVCGLDEAKTGTRLSSASDRRCYREARARLDKQLAAAIDNKTNGG